MWSGSLSLSAESSKRESGEKREKPLAGSGCCTPLLNKADEGSVGETEKSFP
jgi:hypothetical protein